MIEISKKSDCCGCSACACICPQKCIIMQPDEEGFLYPIINKKACINCNMCKQVCPIINQEQGIPFKQNAYLVQIKDEKIRRESTSGGAFSAIAQYVIEQGGIVYGAAYDNKFNVFHISVENIADLSKFRNSKYVQSDVNNTFKEAKEYLEMGKLVCYSGTPCQIEGLKKYVKKEYQNLVTVDVVCRAVPSPLIWTKYREMQAHRFDADIKNIIFRDKYYGYNYSSLTIKDKKGKEIYSYGIDTDPMLRAFFSNICDRPSCYDCKFKKRYRVSDFTLWDCLNVCTYEKSFDDDKGTTCVLIHSDRGRNIFRSIEKNISSVPIDPDRIVQSSKEMFESVSGNSKRKAFLKDANKLSGESLFNKYFPVTIKSRIERLLRIFSEKAGIYNSVKKIYKQFLKINDGD